MKRSPMTVHRVMSCNVAVSRSVSSYKESDFNWREWECQVLRTWKMSGNSQRNEIWNISRFYMSLNGDEILSWKLNAQFVGFMQVFTQSEELEWISDETLTIAFWNYMRNRFLLQSLAPQTADVNVSKINKQRNSSENLQGLLSELMT